MEGKRHDNSLHCTDFYHGTAQYLNLSLSDSDKKNSIGGGHEAFLSQCFKNGRSSKPGKLQWRQRSCFSKGLKSRRESRTRYLDLLVAMVEVLSGMTGERITAFGDGEADEEHGCQLWVLKESLATMFGKPRFQLKLLQNNEELHGDHTWVLGCVQLIFSTPSRSDEDLDLLMHACLRSASHSMNDNDVQFLSLLEKPVEVDFVREIDSGICTPLHVVAETGNLRYIQLLVEAKANIEREARCMRHECAIEIAAECGFHKIVQFLVECGQSQAMKDRALLVASRFDLETVKYLVGSGAASANATSQEGFHLTPLWHASAQGRSEIVEFLLDVLADCNVCTAHDGETPLKRATDEGHLRIVELLVRSNAELNRRGTDERSLTPLASAIDGTWYAIASFLITSKANVQDTRTQSPLLRAARRGAPVSLIRLLVEARAKLEERRRNDGQTALQVASVRGDQNTVQYLIEQGASI